MMSLPINQIIQGDCREVMRRFPPESIDLVMFSPPYYGSRDYGEATETVWGGDQNCKHEWIEERMTLMHENRNFLIGKQEEDHKAKPTTYIKKYDDKTSKFCVKCGAWRGQLGLEPSWQMYIQHMIEICREIKRVLKKTGSMYIVIGDTYAGSHRGRGDKTLFQNYRRIKVDGNLYDEPSPQATADLPPKCLMGIPWRLAFALMDDGWILRNDIIWYKPNHMPSSVKDRLTQTYEHIFHFVKSRKYYYNLDAIREPHKTESVERWNRALRQTKNTNAKLRRKLLETTRVVFSTIVPKWFEYTKHDLAVGRVGNYSYTDPLHSKAYNIKGKNPGDFWSVPTKPFKAAHFAVYPVSICVRPILSSCPPDGIVLDPMVGSGTTCLAAQLINLKRWDLLDYEPNEIAKNTNWALKWIGIDVNPEYVKIANNRLKPFLLKTLLI